MKNCTETRVNSSFTQSNLFRLRKRASRTRWLCFQQKYPSTFRGNEWLTQHELSALWERTQEAIPHLCSSTFLWSMRAGPFSYSPWSVWVQKRRESSYCAVWQPHKHATSICCPSAWLPHSPKGTVFTILHWVCSKVIFSLKLLQLITKHSGI